MQDALYRGIGSFQDTAAKLAELGRNGDSFIVHAARGEHVIPMEVLENNPRLKNLLWQHMREMDLEPERYIVGNELNSINPHTGQPEFFLGGLWDGIKSVLKIAAPVLGAVAGSFIPIPVVGPMLGSFVASKIAGYDTKTAMFGAAASGLGAYALSGSAAATAGGYGTPGTSLGSALFKGAGQQGIGSLFRAPATTAAAMPTTTPAFSSPQTAAAMASKTASVVPTAAAPAAAPSSVFGGIMDFAKNNPGLVIGAGSALASLMDQPESVSAKYFNRGPTASQLVREHPERYTIFHGGGMRANYPRTQIQVPTKGYGKRKKGVFAEAGGEIVGPGHGTSDSVPAMLSDGEFVFTAKAVLGAGKGDRMRGAKKMYQMMKKYEAAHG